MKHSFGKKLGHIARLICSPKVVQLGAFFLSVGMLSVYGNPRSELRETLAQMVLKSGSNTLANKGPAIFVPK